MTPVENFKTLDTYPELLIGDWGTIKLSNGRIINSINSRGYRRIKFKNPLTGQYIFESVHRLVAKAHLPVSTVDRIHVNHINGIKNDNRLVNLEWCTPTENNYHAGRLGLTTKCVPVDILDVKTNIVTSYPSCNVAAEALGISADRVVFASKKPNNLIYDGGWRIKLLSEFWLDMAKDEINSKAYRKGTNHNPVTVRNIDTLEEVIFSRQEQAAEFLGVVDGVISKLLKTSPRRVTLDWWQVKYTHETWEPITDKWKMLAQSNTAVRPVKLTLPDNTIKMFRSTQDCATYLGVGITVVNYNLKFKHGVRNKHNCIFEYYC